MERPAEIQQLLDDLALEKPDSRITCHGDSRLVIAIESAEEQHEFNAEETMLVLSSPSAIARLFEVLGDPEDASVALYSLTIDDEEVLDYLEKRAVAVDEF